MTRAIALQALLLIAFGLLSLTTQGQERTLDEVRQSVQSDLEQSLANLANRREQIAAEKIPLVSALNAIEGEIRELRTEALRQQSIRDSRELSLADLNASIQSWESENLYILNLLDEYASRFQTALNISELDQYAQRLADYRDATGSETGQAAVDAQLTLVDTGLERIRASLGGSQYPGNIVTAEGNLDPGTFTRFGPLVYFISDNRETGGIVSAEQGLNPRILSMADTLDELTRLANANLVELPVDVTEGRVAQISSSQEGLFTHVARGGVWIVPILFFALLSLAISVYKAVQIFRIKIPSAEDVRSILASVRQRDTDRAVQLSLGIPAPVGPMLAAGVKNSGKPPELVEEVLYENILEARPMLNKLLPVIATTAAVAPLLGLLGTVTGMINTFNLISIFGTGDARVLSSGISEALVTTEFGLIVAIPALLVHALLSRRIKSILGDMEKYALIFTNGLSIDEKVAKDA